MGFFKISVFALTPFLLLGCVTRAVQTEKFFASAHTIPETSEIKNVSFIDQSVGYCGPATLTMAMQWAGKKVSVDEVAPQVYTPGLKGSLQADMISASRRHGLMAVPIEGLVALLNEVAAGHPVIIFENLSLSWAPNWHYALVLGYDLQKKEIVMHSGHDAYFRWDMKKFERSWMLGDYWGLVVLPAGQLAVSANEMANVKAAVGLEQAQQDLGAEKSYRKILEKWPNSLIALVGLANLSYKKGDRKEAIKILLKAQKAHPDSEAVRHNLAVAQSKK